ncbi:MAG: HepT-like ribonuclease domain-containing protein [Candidatus Aenigmatarchaeota archaeon]
MKLLENILRFERHYSKAVQLKDKDIADYLIYNTLAMDCFQAVNALIEIGEILVTKNKIGFPSTYREIFELLFKEGFLTEEEFESAKRLVYLRNLISHEYYRISESELLEMVELLEKIKEFVERIKKQEGKNE